MKRGDVERVLFDARPGEHCTRVGLARGPHELLREGGDEAVVCPDLDGLAISEKTRIP